MTSLSISVPDYMPNFSTTCVNGMTSLPFMVNIYANDTPEMSDNCIECRVVISGTNNRYYFYLMFSDIHGPFNRNLLDITDYHPEYSLQPVTPGHYKLIFCVKHRLYSISPVTECGVISRSYMLFSTSQIDNFQLKLMIFSKWRSNTINTCRLYSIKHIDYCYCHASIICQPDPDID